MRADACHPFFFLVYLRRLLISKDQRVRVNRNIRIPEVRVIDENDEQLGVMATHEAQALADERGVDLVEISPTARPPVCRIMDYGKYKYEQSKKLKESKKKQHVIQIKEIKLRPKTEEHDYQFKKRHAESFLLKNNKVKFTIVFRGRELDHKDLGFKILKRIEEDLAGTGEVERPARFEGRLMILYMKPSETQKQSKRKPKKTLLEEPIEQPVEPIQNQASPEPEAQPENKEEVKDAEN